MHQQSYDSICQKLVVLEKKLIPKNSNSDFEAGSLGFLVREILQRLDYFKTNPVFPLWPVLQSLVAITDSSLLDNFSSDEQKLTSQLAAIGAVLNIQPGLKIYEPAEFIAKLGAADSVEKDFGNLVYTLADAYDDKEGLEIASSLINWLGQEININNDTASWQENFLLTLILHVVFNRFWLLSQEKQDMLLRRYYFLAIVAGVPVRDCISRFLADSYDVLAFGTKHIVLLSALKENQEEVFVDSAGKETEILSVLLKKYSVETIAEKDLKNQISRVYAQAPLGKTYTVWLTEAVLIFRNLSTATLASKDQFQFSAGAQFGIELQNLVGYVVNKKDWPKILDYYHQPEPFVPVKSLLKELTSYLDINTESAQNRVAELVDFLKSNKLLETDFDMLIFHESDGQFHWNTDILK